MDNDTLDRELKATIVECLYLDVEPDDMDTDAPLSDYGVDSFFLVEVIVELERRFEVIIQPSDVTSETLHSVATIRELVKGLKAQA